MPRGVNDYDTAKLQGRNVSNADSFSIISPGLVTAGLVLHLDAGNFNSYPAAGTVWSDISSSSTLCTISGSPTYSQADGGTLSFTGTGQYANNTTANLALGTNASLAAWVKHSSTTGQQRYITLGNEDFCIRSDSATLQTFIKLSGTIRTLAGSATNTNWSYVVSTWDGSVLRFYRNAVQMSTSTPPAGSLTTSLLGYLISHGGTEYMRGNISNISAYNRALTPTEVEQNFNATRARFGI